MKKIYVFSLLFLIVMLLQSSLASQKLIIQKYNEESKHALKQEYSLFYGDSVRLFEGEGELRIKELRIKTEYPFILNQDYSWEFYVSHQIESPTVIYNNNPDIKWYYSNDQKASWHEIKAASLKVLHAGTLYLKFIYEADNTFQPLPMYQPEKFPGFWQPIFAVKLKPISFQFVDFKKIDQKCLFQVEINDSSLLEKNLTFIYSVNGATKSFTKTFSSTTEMVSISLPLKIAIYNQTDDYEMIIKHRHKLKEYVLSSIRFRLDDFQYHPPNFLFNQEKIQLNVLTLQPDFRNSGIYQNPELLKGFLMKAQELKFNALNVPMEVLSPALIHIARDLNFFIFADKMNSATFKYFYTTGLLNSAHVSGFIWNEAPDPEIKSYVHNYIIMRYLLNSAVNRSISIQSSVLPIFSLEQFSDANFNLLMNMVKSYGGIVENRGYGYTITDSLRLKFKSEEAFSNTITKLKENLRSKVSNSIFHLSSFQNKYMVADWMLKNPEMESRYPYSLMDGGKVKIREYSDLITSLNSDLPIYLQTETTTSGAAAWYIGTGIINFFLFLFYLKTLKPFQMYFSRALRRSRSFFMDLYEKIAVPWNETLLLNTFNAMGFALTAGILCHLFYDNLPVNYLINIILVKPVIAYYFMVVSHIPYLNIIMFFILYWLYLFLFAVLIKLAAVIFRRRLRPGFAFALTSWGHILFVVLIPTGMVLYNMILRYSFGTEFIYAILVVLFFSWLRLLNGLKLSLGILKYKINLFFIFILLLAGLGIYFSGYPFRDVLNHLREFKLLYLL
ncbi:MAG: hypothetical protein Kow00108_07270 [Calditrichia bacterium]